MFTVHGSRAAARPAGSKPSSSQTVSRVATRSACHRHAARPISRSSSTGWRHHRTPKRRGEQHKRTTIHALRVGAPVTANSEQSRRASVAVARRPRALGAAAHWRIDLDTHAAGMAHERNNEPSTQCALSVDCLVAACTLPPPLPPQISITRCPQPVAMRPTLLVLVVVVLSCAVSVMCVAASPVLYVSFHGGNDGINNINSYSLTGELIKANVLNGDTSSGATTATANTSSARERATATAMARQGRVLQQ